MYNCVCLILDFKDFATLKAVCQQSVLLESRPICISWIYVRMTFHWQRNLPTGFIESTRFSFLFLFPSYNFAPELHNVKGKQTRLKEFPSGKIKLITLLVVPLITPQQNYSEVQLVKTRKDLMFHIQLYRNRLVAV